MTEALPAQAWADALAAFDVWADMPEADRAAWLETLATRQPDVHARLLALMRADQEAAEQSFLSPHDTVAAPAAGLKGRRLGPWLVQRLIGRGGMGQVWLARRTDGLYEGLAAIKLLRLAAADAAADARFAREGRLLGRLNHPNIARLLDAGVTSAGERYLVLEYVDGERIDRWCDAHRLPLPRRIALFLDVCTAVAHAHENLIVHRDLKPSNIFVTAAGEVKLLDFGVAKLLDSEAGAASELTREAGAALTPEYAAPEQVEGGAVTTATDVYGLGLVLYGLLSGSRPWRDGATPSSPPRTVSAAAPPRPLWTVPAESAARIAQDRATTPAALRKALHGDIAVVVAKAIKAAPGERYRSVPDFADDLRRTLDRRPIAARPDSALYRLRRFVQRHALAVGAAALVVVSVTGGVVGTLVKAREAERQAQRAVAVKHFLLDLFEQARSSVKVNGTQAREATVNDMLAAGADRVDKAFASQPEIRDEVFQILVELFSDTGERAQIVSLARRRLAAAQAAWGAEDARSAPAEVMLAAVLLNFGELPEADKRLAHAQQLLDRAGDHGSIERARLLRWQGLQALQEGRRPPWAEHPLKQAVTLLRARYADDDELLVALAMLPPLACRYGQTEEAMATAQELYTRTRQRYGGDNLYTAEADQLRGNLMVMGGQAQAALPILRQVLVDYRRFVGEKSPNVVTVQLLIAKAEQAAGHADAADAALAQGRALLARDHAGDKRLLQQLAEFSDEIAQMRAGHVLHCGG